MLSTSTESHIISGKNLNFYYPNLCLCIKFCVTTHSTFHINLDESVLEILLNFTEFLVHPAHQTYDLDLQSVRRNLTTVS